MVLTGPEFYISVWWSEFCANGLYTLLLWPFPPQSARKEAFMEKDSVYRTLISGGMQPAEGPTVKGLWDAILSDNKLRSQLIRELEMDSINTLSFSDLGIRGDTEEVSKENFVDF